MSMYQNQTLTDLMSERNFIFHDVIRYNETNKHCFQFVKDNIICEVIANGIYRFIYTNENILGWMSSGWLNEITNDNLFNDYLLRFNNSIQPLVDAYE